MFVVEEVLLTFLSLKSCFIHKCPLHKGFMLYIFFYFIHTLHLLLFTLYPFVFSLFYCSLFYLYFTFVLFTEFYLSFTLNYKSWLMSFVSILINKNIPSYCLLFSQGYCKDTKEVQL